VSPIASELALLLALLLANGVFAMAEIALVSAKKARLRQLAEEGDPRARIALDLAESPNRFLSTVQIGITFVGVFAGAFGGASLTRELTPLIAQVPFLANAADKLAFASVVAGITYLSLVLGELAPKRLGLGNPEGVAMALARPMQMLSSLVGPAVTFLSASTDGLLRLVGLTPAEQALVSDEEVRGLIREGVRVGAFNTVESRIVESALELDELAVREIMTPRPKVIWLSHADSHDQIWHKIIVSGHSHFPVYEENRDRALGFVSVKSIYAHLAAGLPIQLRDLVVPPLIVPETQTVLALVQTFKDSGKHTALVTDEFGSLIGMVTLNDVLEALVGEFPSPGERAKPQAKLREDGSWLIDAMIDLDGVESALPNFRFPEGAGSEYQTLAGFIVKSMGQVPAEGDAFEVQSYRFEILDMDHHRVDKVLVVHKTEGAPPRAD
jgi:putative hemolysin